MVHTMKFKNSSFKVTYLKSKRPDGNLLGAADIKKKNKVRQWRVYLKILDDIEDADER